MLKKLSKIKTGTEIVTQDWLMVNLFQSLQLEELVIMPGIPKDSRLFCTK